MKYTYTNKISAKANKSVSIHQRQIVCMRDLGGLGCGFVLLYAIFYILYSIFDIRSCIIKFYILYSIFYIQ